MLCFPSFIYYFYCIFVGQIIKPDYLWRAEQKNSFQVSFYKPTNLKLSERLNIMCPSQDLLETWGDVTYSTVRQSWRKLSIFSRDGQLCVYCLGASGCKNLSLDHVIPQVHGGPNVPSNFVTACISCNSTKKHASLEVLCERLERKGISSEGLIERTRAAQSAPWSKP